MKRMKRLLAYLLCMAMLAGSIPMSVMAEEIVAPVAEDKSEVVDAALFFSDLHTSQNDYKDSLIKSIMSGIKTSGLDFSSVTSVGDAFSSNETAYTGDTSKITKSIRDGLGDTDVPVFYAWSDHDRGAEDIENYTGLMYGDVTSAKNYDEDAEYYIYTISMSDMTADTRYNVASTYSSDKLTAFTETIETLDTSKPLFIVSHQPLHARRGDNQYADEWYGVITEAAKKMDVTFFWGHNHTGETSVDQNAFYVEKNGNETMTIEGMNSSIVPNFTYLNAGYFGDSVYDTQVRSQVATVVTIYEDKINYTVYDKDGVYDGNYSLNEDVSREFAEDEESLEGYTLSGIAVSNIEKTEYLVNDSLNIDNIKVIATYVKAGSDDITRTLSQYDGTETSDGYTVSAVDMSQTGKKTVTINYQGAATSFEIEVFNKDFPDTNTGVQVEVNVPGATDITVENLDSENATISAAVASVVKNYIAYNIELTGYEQGQKVTVTLPVPEEVSNPVVYYVSDDGTTVTNMNAVVSADGTTVSFETDHFSTYIVGENAIEEPLENQVTTGGTTYEEKTVYVKVDSFENGKKYLLIGEDAVTNGKPIVLVNNKGSDIKDEVTVISGSVIADNVTYSDGYIELNNSNAVFSASGDDSAGYTLKNGKYYIGGKDATTLRDNSNNAVKVTYDANTERLKTASGTTRYLYYSTSQNETWKWSTKINSNSSSRKMYIYKEVTAKIPTSNEVTYTMQASEMEHVLDTTAVGYTNSQKLEYALLANGETAISLPSGGSYKFEIKNDTNAIINSIREDGTITFNNVVGKANVKVSYTWTEGETSYTVYKYVEASTVEPYYTVEITHDGDKDSTTENTVVTNTIFVKSVKVGDAYALDATVLQNGDTSAAYDSAKLSWASSDESIATVDTNGKITFSGTEGKVQITVVYSYGNGKTATDTVNLSVSQDSYIVPEDGTDDFPEYPNEGAIRYDKNATAVGNFSQTGIAQVELSMTGVPFTTGNELDVVMMLDRSSSMTNTRINATKEAAKVFVKNVVMNEDGTFNGNRIYVGDFLGGNPAYSNQSQHNFQINAMTSNEEDGFQIVNDQKELDSLLAKIDRVFVRQNNVYGTEYAQSLEYCYNLLNSTKDDGHKQFCVFMSDGIPNVYQYSATGKYKATADMAEMFTGTNYNTRSEKYHYEYYSTLMKNNGVTVFSVGLGLKNTNSAWSGVDATHCLNAASLLLNDISGPAGEKEPDTSSTLSKKDTYFFSVDDANAAAGMEDVFKNISQKILEAATNVVVQDKVADEYTMVFDIPEGNIDITGLDGQEFYIEVKEYTLDADHERTSAYTSLAKIYLGESNGTYYAASDSNGTAYESPVFTAVAKDADGNKIEKGYYSIVDSSYAAAKDEIVLNVNGTYYKFIPDGTGDYNMTSGAYAYGTIDSETNMSNDLVIVTPYFCYSAKTRMLAWTADKLTTTELALSYFLYLDNSATEVGTEKETDAASYPTNDYATITYTNYKGNECQQVFPIPQLTWNGAQVSYVFYLVNAQGQPINKSGQIVDFANASFITDVFTEAVVWNKDEGITSLEAIRKAEELLPDSYTLYDSSAKYEIHVYQTEEGADIYNYFEITEGKGTTKVYNTKASTKYSEPGKYIAENVYTGFDFANTTVAFAVVWEPALVPDAIVVDYGLPVLINVVQNDLMQNTVTGIGSNNGVYGAVAMNTGVATTSKLDALSLTTSVGSTVSIESDSTIRYTQNDMTFETHDTFYYESPVTFYEGSNKQSGYMYSSVTIIPATTVYYEDSFVSYSNSSAAYAENEVNYGAWISDGTEQSATQASDRPGTSLISAALDADNNYGYDAAYDNCTQYSMGSAKKVTVNTTTGAKGSNPSATFTFSGTGFDLISLTDNTSGMIKVTVKDSSGATVKTMSVNNYYGYTYLEENGWVTTDSADPNALYQVPVIQITDLSEEPAVYTVTVDVMYMSTMDNTGNGEYNFWLDAVRVYDPASTSNETVKAAYTADKEFNPGYIELRDLLLGADVLVESDDTTQDGVVFIDGIPTADITEYEACGPNNEVYLTERQAVAFKMIADKKPESVQIGAKLAYGDSAALYMNGKAFQTLNSATDRNYVLDDITWTKNESTGHYESGLIVLSNNTDNSIISLTNLKAINAIFVTSNSASAASVMSLDVEEDTTAEIAVVSSYAMARRAVEIVNAIDKVIFVPESIDAYWSPLSVAGKKTTLTVVTSEDVEKLEIDGVFITEYKTKKTYSGTFSNYAETPKRVWSYSITAPEKGTYGYDIIAYDVDGNQSEPLTTTLTVKGSILESLFPWLF